MDTSVHQHECCLWQVWSGGFEAFAVCLVLRVVRRGLAAGEKSSAELFIAVSNLHQIALWGFMIIFLFAGYGSAVTIEIP